MVDLQANPVLKVVTEMDIYSFLQRNLVYYANVCCNKNHKKATRDKFC